MLSSPVWRGVSAYAFAAGLVLGGILSGLGLLLIGSVARAVIPDSAGAVVAGVSLAVTLVLVAREFGVLRFALPQNARLVPESVFRHGRVFGPLQFGLEMGTGMRTFVTSGLPYAALLLVAVLATPVAAVAAGAAFGLGRALMTFGSLHYGEPGDWDLVWLDRERWLKAALVLAFCVAQVAVVLPVF